MKVFRGRLVHSIKANDIEVLSDALIGYEDNGRIIFIDDGRSLVQLQKSYGFNDSDVQTLLPSQFLMPGFVDTHIHAPQYRFTGTGYDKQLLDWLETYTFPTETKFSDTAVAHEVYPQVVRRTLCNGTTTASYFATIHLESTKELCKVISKYGQRALVGKVNMDCRSPPNYIETTEDSIQDTIAFVDFVKEMKNPLIKPVITPRFSPTCTETLMRQLAQIATEKDLHIQSHLCEQLSEIDYTLNVCYPNYKNCTEIFDKVGILTEKTYVAHCVHMTNEELEVLKERKVGIAHCPLSNFCICSGHMDARDKLSRGMKIGLGTDVSGGFSTSILDAIRNAVLASKSIYIKNEEQQRQSKEQYKQQYDPITLDEAFFMATLGGAQDDQIGNFQVGKQFDALVIDTKASENFNIFPDDDFKDILSKFLYLGDDRNIVRVFVAGHEVINKLF